MCQAALSLLLRCRCASRPYFARSTSRPRTSVVLVDSNLAYKSCKYWFAPFSIWNNWNFFNCKNSLRRMFSATFFWIKNIYGYDIQFAIKPTMARHGWVECRITHAKKQAENSFKTVKNNCTLKIQRIYLANGQAKLSRILNQQIDLVRWFKKYILSDSYVEGIELFV